MSTTFNRWSLLQIFTSDSTRNNFNVPGQLLWLLLKRVCTTPRRNNNARQRPRVATTTIYPAMPHSGQPNSHRSKVNNDRTQQNSNVAPCMTIWKWMTWSTKKHIILSYSTTCKTGISYYEKPCCHSCFWSLKTAQNWSTLSQTKSIKDEVRQKIKQQKNERKKIIGLNQVEYELIANACNN